MFINNQVWIAIFATILIPLILGGPQQEKTCSNHLTGLYYGNWDKQGEKDKSRFLASLGMTRGRVKS